MNKDNLELSIEKKEAALVMGVDDEGGAQFKLVSPYVAEMKDEHGSDYMDVTQIHLMLLLALFHKINKDESGKWGSALIKEMINDAAEEAERQKEKED